MVIVDAHCDSITGAMDKNVNLYGNDLHFDLQRISGNWNHVQFFAAFVDPLEYKGFEMQRLIRILDFFQQQAEQFGDYIAICRNFTEIQGALDSGRLAAIISVENGGALHGDLSALRVFYRLGVRSICLTWNFANEIADGVKDSEHGMGLTAFGKEVVAEMNRLGMLVDVSHLSEKSFWDVMEIAKAPVIASHSNSRAICSHPRNLDDLQLKAIKSSNGVTGINLYPFFLNNTEHAAIDDIIRHIEHVAAVTGEDHIGLGADFDGVECLPEGIGGIQNIGRIIERLLILNYSQSFVDKFAGGNFLRVIGEVMR
ncbi:MAG: membrane dipeptidase [Ruminiclostridium sp.]|nr:membrane dipeptidase [Ruminiclostridium sp.]